MGELSGFATHPEGRSHGSGVQVEMFSEIQSHIAQQTGGRRFLSPVAFLGSHRADADADAAATAATTTTTTTTGGGFGGGLIVG